MSDLVNLCPVPGVSETVVKRALAGEFVNLEDYLENLHISRDSASEMKTYLDTSGNLSYKPMKTKRKINDLLSWLEGFQNFERLLIVAHGPHLYDHLTTYKNRIIDLTRKFTWNACFTLDLRHRGRLHRVSMCYANVPFDLMSTILDSTAVRDDVPKCNRCGSFNHTKMDQCPFQPAPPAQHSASSTPNQGKKGKGVSSGEPCHLWNGGKCHYINCRRAHQCTKCRGDTPFIICRKTGRCAGQQGKVSPQ